MTSTPLRISTAIGDVLQQFQSCVTTGIELSPDRTSNLVLILATLQKLAMSIELELDAHRLGETNRLGRESVEALASEQLRTLLYEADGKIIRPVFRREP